MNKKTKYAIYIGLAGIVMGLLGEMFPDSLKTKIQGVFPIPLSISFEFAWVITVLVAVLLSIWFVLKYEMADAVPTLAEVRQMTSENIDEKKQSSGGIPVKMFENSLNQSQISKSKKTTKDMNKEQILSLIDDDIDAAFEELDKIFLGKNATYKDLSKEYFEQPNNFSLATFRSRLKVFVRVNWK